MKDWHRKIGTKDDVVRLFDDFTKIKVMVVGDVMVDAYVFGTVDRISPEAPVPVVAVSERINRLGGAANVALNIHALGAAPLLVSVIGNDAKGNEMMAMLRNLNMSTKGIVQSPERITTTKFRVIGNKMQMLRVDEEITCDIGTDDELKLLQRIEKMFATEKVDVIILQDYNKGVLTENVIQHILGMAERSNIPVTVDPKKKHFLNYKGVTLFKPNLKELKEGLGLDFDSTNLAEVKMAMTKLMATIGASGVMATLSERGVIIAWSTENVAEYLHIPAHLRSIADVSGAGDTVISVASACLALGLHPADMARMANLAGGLVCEQVGVVPVERQRFMNEALKQTDFVNE